VTVNQDSGCTFTIAPTAQNIAVAGGPITVAVTASNGGCAWASVSNVPWITITTGVNGSGNGNVQLTVDANATGAARNGTVTIAGQTFTVTQDGV
jgi:hypothetical protein